MDGRSESQLKRESLDLRAGFSNVLIGINILLSLLILCLDDDLDPGQKGSL